MPRLASIGRIRLGQRQLDRQVIDLFPLGDVFRHVHAGVVVPGQVRQVGVAVPLVVLHVLTLEREDDIVGVEVAGRLEIVGGLELHAGMQMEGVGQAVVRDFPAVGEARLDFGAAMLELDQARIDGARGGVEVVAAGGGAGIEIGRRCFRTVDQRLGVRAAAEYGCGQQRSHKTHFFLHRALPFFAAGPSTRPAKGAYKHRIRAIGTPRVSAAREPEQTCAIGVENRQICCQGGVARIIACAFHGFGETSHWNRSIAIHI